MQVGVVLLALRKRSHVVEWNAMSILADKRCILVGTAELSRTISEHRRTMRALRLFLLACLAVGSAACPDLVVTPTPDHAIARGIPTFQANDEWYYRMRWAEPKTAVDLLTATPTRERINRYIHWTPAGEEALGSTQTLMWAVERSDGGRGVGFTGGHWHRNWAVDDFRRLVLNAIAWTAKVDVPDGGVVSEPITERQLNENLDPKKTMVHVALPSEADLTQPSAEPVEFRWPGKR